MKGVWIMGYCLKACLEGVPMLFAIWTLSGWRVNVCAWRVPGRCFGAIGIVFGQSLEGVWMVSGRCLDGVWTVSVFWVIIWWVS